METILVTGANRGIGLEFVAQYLNLGKRVIASCRNPDDARMLSILRESHAESLRVVRLDVRDEASLNTLVQTLEGEPLDVLINNAGIKGGSQQDARGIDFREWTNAFEVNTIAPCRITLALVANLRLSPRPRVITLSSQMGSLQRISSGYYAYRSSKAAVNKVMQLLAQDLRAYGIVACPVHPGWVQTDMGGAEAELTVQESVSSLIELIDGLTLSRSGRFLKWNGEEHPW
jgi:NAD(P)-dependent dehydrogenase (short-subunit alcohol dehydrogenase family)